MNTADKLLLRALRSERLERPPLWLMRQAGRYLPEYRATRTKAGSFLSLCYNPELAVEVTLQPIRRFGFDAAILFSDILVVPDALGQKVGFEEGRGPVLEALQDGDDLSRLLGMAGFHRRLAPVYETVKGIKAALPAETALIGFAGAPWTVASYMIEGGSSRDFAKAKQWIYRRPKEFATLIEQLFDSWAGGLSHAEMLRWCLEPAKAIIARVRMMHPEVPFILFPRGVGAGYLDFARAGIGNGLGIDQSVPLEWAWTQLQGKHALQGNLDPQLVVAGGQAMQDATLRILETLNRGPFIFNLGHGIVPETPPEHVGQLAELVRGWRG
jgi:uroporphyrinogen decarboxylase